MKDRYEKGDQVVIVDWVKNDEVCYREFEQGNYRGAYRKDEDDFRKSLRKWLKPNALDAAKEG